MSPPLAQVRAPTTTECPQPQATVSQPVRCLLYVPEITLRLRKGVQRETNSPPLQPCVFLLLVRTALQQYVPVITVVTGFPGSQAMLTPVAAWQHDLD